MQPIKLTPAQADLLRTTAQEIAQIRTILELREKFRSDLVNMLVRDSGQALKDGQRIGFGISMDGDQPLLVITEGQ